MILPLLLTLGSSAASTGGTVACGRRTADTDVDPQRDVRHVQVDGGGSTISVSPCLSVVALLGPAIRGITAEDEDMVSEALGQVAADPEAARVLSAYASSGDQPDAVRRLALRGLGYVPYTNADIARVALRAALASTSTTLVDAALRAVDCGRIEGLDDAVGRVVAREDLPRWLRSYAVDLLG